MEARISGTTKLFGLIGSPVSHSASPAMQNYGFQACGVDGAYLAFDIKEEEVPEFIKSMRLLNIQGCNVTMPNKTAAAQNMDELSSSRTDRSCKHNRKQRRKIIRTYHRW